MKTFREIRNNLLTKAGLNEKVYRPPGSMSTLGGIMAQGFKKHIEKTKMSKIDERKLTKMWGDWCMRKGYAAALDYVLDMQKKAKLPEGTFLLFGMKGHKSAKWIKEEDLSMEDVQDYYRMENDFVIMIQGTDDQAELKAMMRALKGSFRSKPIRGLDSMKGGKVKFSPGITLEIRDAFDLIIDDK